MRLIIKLMLLLLLVALVAPFTLPLKNGAPLLKWSEIKIPGASWLPQLPDFTPLTRSGSEEGGSVPLTSYKWQGADGNWHFGDTPPKNIAYETVTVDPNTNLIQATIPSSVPAAAPSGTVKNPQPQPAYSPAMAYDPEKVGEIMDSARNVENLLQQRKEQQDQLLKAIQ
jgi:hypothetical protein